MHNFFIVFLKIISVIFFQNYSVKVIDDIGYNLGEYLILDKNDKILNTGNAINFSDFLKYLQKNSNNTLINQYNDIVNKMAKIELKRAKRKYETTFAQYVMESSTVLNEENLKRKRELKLIKENLTDYKFYIEDVLTNVKVFISDSRDCNSDFFISYNEFFDNCK
ncbi:MAG: hypothetical protein ACJ0P5_04480 [Flavobacteriaceae bacterium]|tara:strand:- start:7084 stop:7578 length:495 start_codon:yes stop_codon:yes gene_type:complete